MGGLVCAIHQPNFFPRLSTLAKLFTADIWIILDDVQFARRDYQHRCHLAPVGDAGLPERWLTVPVHLPSGRSTLIKDVQIAEPELTLRRVTGLLHQYYRRSPYRAAIWDDGRLAGFAAYSFLWPAIGLTRSLYLKELYVSTEARRIGIGRLLMRRLYDIAVKNDCSRVEWTTDSDNQKAQLFYAELGVPVKESKLFYRIEGDELTRRANP